MAGQRCAKCGTQLLVDTEVDRKYQGGGAFIGANAGDRALEYAARRQRDADAAGVSCAVCGQSFCVKCMKTYGRPHSSSGGLACLSCGGHLTQYRG
jgi:DNA-directed RNA polymerase subunit RPC12/RpoP